MRVLQERRFRPVGGKEEISSNFRLIAATNRDLEAMATEGLFREDLLFRLKSFTIHLPPLREREEDIKELVHYCVTKQRDEKNEDTKGLAPEFLAALQSYHWPGNIRELFNTLEMAKASAWLDPVLYPKHLPSNIRIQNVREQAPGVKVSLDSSSGDIQFKEDFPSLKKFRNSTQEAAEERYLRALMQHVEGDRKEACRLADLSEPRLYALLKKYNLPRFRS